MIDPETLDHVPLTFGKHVGKTPEQVSDIDHKWLIWAYENIKNRTVCSKNLYHACCEDNYNIDWGEHDAEGDRYQC
jgi:hypothetical protein